MDIKVILYEFLIFLMRILRSAHMSNSLSRINNNNYYNYNNNNNNNNNSFNFY